MPRRPPWVVVTEIEPGSWRSVPSCVEPLPEGGFEDVSRLMVKLGYVWDASMSRTEHRSFVFHLGQRHRKVHVWFAPSSAVDQPGHRQPSGALATGSGLEVDDDVGGESGERGDIAGIEVVGVGVSDADGAEHMATGADERGAGVAADPVHCHYRVG